MIEGIIAVGIISTALIVGLSLAYSNLTAARANSDRIIAAHLTREGIEIARNIRDSNWLRRQANIDKDPLTNDLQFFTWDDYFDGWPLLANPASCGASGCGNYFDIYLDPNLAIGPEGSVYKLAKVSANQDLILCARAGDVSCRIQKKLSIYFQAASAVSGASFTPYYRRIILKPICWDGTNEYVDNAGDMTCLTGTKVGVLATSHVLWQYANKILEVKAKERLYNWQNL